MPIWMAGRVGSGMTGADLANLVNEAALLAARHKAGTSSIIATNRCAGEVQLGTARHVVIPEAQRR
jgi:cell division protease FtsH